MLYTKEESTRFAGASINLSGRHANNSHGAKLTTQFVTPRICSLWPWFWKKFKKEFYLQTSALIFSKIALRKDIRAQNDLSVDQLETSTSHPPGKVQAFELLKIGSFKFQPPRAKRVFK